MKLKQTIANFLENPSMIEEKHAKLVEKAIEKKKHKDYFSYKHPVSLRNIDNAFREAIAGNQELTNLMNRYNVSLASMTFTRKEERDEIDANLPTKFIFQNMTRRQIEEERQISNERVQMAKDYVYMSNDQYSLFRRISQLDMPSISVVKNVQVR